MTRTPDQLPARMINEFAYCPRLFYLEYVQQEWAHNADTLEGRWAHRRTDQPSGQAPEAAELTGDSSIHARSVTVGSDKLGAIARIDLLESEGTLVTPVDYKKGSPPDIPEGAWEPERVQVCLQGLLLRENGYQCDEGILYFAETRRRVSVAFTSELVARTLELLQAARETAASGQIPPPLINSPKCPRCSLVGICLPDETNLLRAGESMTTPASERNQDAAAAPPRRLVPARDDRVPLYVRGYGVSLGLKGDVLEVRQKNSVLAQTRLLDTSQVSVFGNVHLSAQALRALMERDVLVLHLSYGGWLTAITTPPTHKNIELRRIQFRAADDPVRCLQLSRAFVAGKIRNARTLLRRNAQDLPPDTLRRMAELRRKAERAEEIEQLLGIEGAAAHEYFSNFGRMLKSPSNGSLPAFQFESRNRRPPRDPVNSLLSFVYAMLTKDMTVTVTGVGFDPFLGFYHQPKYGKPALALDLMEEFRPLIADSTVLSILNTGIVEVSDFIVRAGAAALTDAARKRVIEAYERRLDGLVTHPRFGYTISYRRILEVQARLLARFLTGEIAEYPPFCTR